MTSVPGQSETSPPPRAAAPRAPSNGRTRTSPRYWTCLAVLVLAAIGLKLVARWGDVYLRKEAVPLKRPLSQFDVSKLGPRYELNREATSHIQAPSDDMLESLGTREYAQLILTDTQKPNGDPTRSILLFVTYYTGQPDMVPHVPDDCMLAAGYDPIGAETVDVHVAGVGAPNDQLPVRVVQFRAAPRVTEGVDSPDITTVLYFFHVNDRYACTRDGVRANMMNPWLRYAYYSKIEITFSGAGLRAGRDASVAALEPLLARVLPVLLKEHFDRDKFAPAGGSGPPPLRAAESERG